MKIRHLFEKAKRDKQSLFIPFLTCGDPNLAISESLLISLMVKGADIIELGVPYNDPIADGQTIQKAHDRALKNGIDLKDCCQLVATLRQKGFETPIILFSYVNPIMQFGFDDFAKEAKEAGVDAVLIVDLPPEEAEEWVKSAKAHEIGTVFLISPTTSAKRIIKTTAFEPEFLYYVSKTGVTGADKRLSPSLKAELSWVKTHTHLPIAVGFGISTPAQVEEVGRMAEGVVVGSALVKTLERSDPELAKKDFLDLASSLIAAIRP